MIVVSFYTPRFERYENCNYDQLLMLLDKSCQKLNLKHLVISDEFRPKPLNTYLTYLPENLMQAFLYGQKKILNEIHEPILFVGADCLITRDPMPFFEQDLAITLSDTFSDCKMNTGAIFCNDNDICRLIWDYALSLNPVNWGEDQICLYKAIKDYAETGIKVKELRCEDHNWAPNNLDDNAGMPTVVHFRGNRKSFMSQWADRYLDIKE